MSRASTMRWRKAFDPSPYLDAVGAEPYAASPMTGRLPGGSHITISTDRPGKVCVMLSSHGAEKFHMRTFGAKQFDAIKEWVASGGTIAKEEQTKRARSLGPELLEACELMLSILDSADPPWTGQSADWVRALLVKARAEP